MADWQPGDLALCVKGGGRLNSVPGHERFRENGAEYELRQGKIYTVTKLEIAQGVLGLKVDNLEWYWLASRFRKVTPPKADEFDREVIDLMLGRPARVGADA